MAYVVRRSVLSLAVSFLFASASNLPAQERLPVKPEDVGVSSEKVVELSKYMQSLVDGGKIAGGVTMMARHGKVVHLEAVGMADREAQKPMTKDAIFRIASMTKPITSVAIMMLWEQGKLKLNDPVSEYIPQFENPEVLVSVDPLKTRPAKREITIRDLLTHTSGLGYTPTPGVGPLYKDHGILTGLCSTELTLEEMISRAGKVPIQFDPGTQWQYGLSTDVLGRVIEVVSAKTLDEFINDEICVPLKMGDTYFIVPPEKRTRVVAAYVPEETTARRLKIGDRLNYADTPISSDYHLEFNKYMAGGGGLCSTSGDYMRFCQMLLNGGELNGVRLLKEQTIKQMTTDQTGSLSENFGFGFSMLPNDEGVHQQLRGAYAWGGFWTTSFRVSPKGSRRPCLLELRS